MKYCQEWSIYLVYIYNIFIFNLFLTFLFPLTFFYVFIKFKLVLRYLCGRIEELPYPPALLKIWFIFQICRRLNILVAFNDLRNLKILLCEWKTRFQIGSLRCVKYVEKKSKSQHSISRPLSGRTTFIPKFWKGRNQTKWVPGELK